MWEITFEIWEIPSPKQVILRLILLTLFIALPYFAGRFLFRKMNAQYCRIREPE
jgi:hypothetical protein